MIRIILFICLVGFFGCTENIDNSSTSPAQKMNSNIQALPTTNQVKEDLPKENPSFTLDYIMGKFDPATHPDFMEINPPYSDEKRHLRKEVYAAFVKMQEAAKKDDIRLVVESATRNFANQKRIWEAKWTGKRLIEGGKDASKTWPEPKARALTILKWSSMPGTSRHHWGTDIDINEFENDYFASGQGKKEYEWLQTNAARFGFCQVYTEKEISGRTGYNEEKWHWTYLPTSQQLTEKARRDLKDEMISGFAGSEAAIEVGMVENFVLGINKECL